MRRSSTPTPSPTACGCRGRRRLPDAARDPGKRGRCASRYRTRRWWTGCDDLGRLEGISAAPEGGATLAALDALVARGQIGRDELVVLFNTGGALKVPRSALCLPTTSVAERHANATVPSSPGRSRSARCAGLPTTSSSGIEEISGGCKATILLNSPWSSSSTALPPKRVASTRSKLVGAPPRCRWPRTTLRVSLPVSSRAGPRPAGRRRPGARRGPPRFLDERRLAVLRLGAFGDDDDARTRAPRVAGLMRSRDFLDVVGDLRNQDRRRRRRRRRRRARSSRRSGPSPRRP